MLLWLWRSRLCICFPWKECYISCGGQVCTCDFPGRSATLDLESMVMLIIFPGRKCCFVCGEQRLYNLLFMEECFSILVYYGLQRLIYGLYMHYLTYYVHVCCMVVLIIFKGVLKKYFICLFSCLCFRISIGFCGYRRYRRPYEYFILHIFYVFLQDLMHMMCPIPLHLAHFL